MLGANPERWEVITGLFEQAAALPDAERAGWLARATSDPEIRQAVEQLLAADATPAAVLGASLDELAAAAASPRDLGPELIGERIGAWHILRELGQGGMGTVYLAERADGAYQKQVAVKVVKRGMDTDEILRRFRRERQILAKLEHPHIGRMYDGGVTADGRPYLVMEYVAGEPINRYADARALDVEARLRLMVTVCRTVEHAHRHRIVHRDIKPSNIMVTTDGDVRLLDFGIAKLLDDDVEEGSTRTATGHRLMTPGYASPEQMAGFPTSPSDDVYALGVVLHELLTGRRPPHPLAPVSGGTTTTERLEPPSRAAGRMQLDVAAARRATPSTLRRRFRAEVDTIVLKATELLPAARYDSAGALADDLQRHLEGRSITARPPSLRAAVLGALTSRRALQWGVPAGAVLVTILALKLFTGSPGNGTATAQRPLTLAVVPTAADPRDSANAYLVQGISDELTTRLGRLRRLRVKSPRAVAAASREGASPSVLGQRLGVAYLIESTIRRRDSVIDISLSLVEADGGFQLWADDYSTTSADLLSVQDSMVRDIAAAVTGELSDEERAVLGTRLSSSPVAFDHFMRAGFLLRNRTPTAVRGAIREYEIAIGQDARFAEALARAAYAILMYLDWGWPYPDQTRAELLRKAQSLADRALEIDPGSAEVWLSQAYLRVLRDPLRHEGAVAAFERTLRIDSMNAEAQYQYGQTLMQLGRDADAIAAYQRTLALEPQRPMTLVSLGATQSIAGDAVAGRRSMDSALAVAGTVPVPYALTAWAHSALASGGAGSAAAADAARRALAMDDSYPAPALSALVMAQAADGDTATAAATARTLLASFDTTAPTPTDARFVSPALAALGRTDAALSLLERARPAGAQLWFYMRSREFSTLRDHPRFRALFSRIDPRADTPPPPPP